MYSLFKPHSILSLFVAAGAAFLTTACDRNPTDPAQPTTEREEDMNRNPATAPATPATPPPAEPVTPGQPVTPGDGTVTPGGGTGTPGSGTGTQ